MRSWVAAVAFLNQTVPRFEGYYGLAAAAGGGFALHRAACCNCRDHIAGGRTRIGPAWGAASAMASCLDEHTLGAGSLDQGQGCAHRGWRAGPALRRAEEVLAGR